MSVYLQKKKTMINYKVTALVKLQKKKNMELKEEQKVANNWP